MVWEEINGNCESMAWAAARVERSVRDVMELIKTIRYIFGHHSVQGPGRDDLTAQPAPVCLMIPPLHDLGQRGS